MRPPGRGRAGGPEPCREPQRGQSALQRPMAVGDIEDVAGEPAQGRHVLALRATGKASALPGQAVELPSDPALPGRARVWVSRALHRRSVLARQAHTRCVVQVKTFGCVLPACS